MVHRRVRLADPGGSLADRFAAIRDALGVPVAFPPDVLAAAAVVPPPDDRTDLRDVEFVTVDPPGSTDLDQALFLARDGEGFLVRYAIADVPFFVPPGGPVDAEARRRGETIYSPDLRTPLHPPSLSEGAASLLPGQDRPAFAWTFALDSSGAVRSTRLERALVRSRQQLTYDDVGGMELLRAVGEVRRALEVARGGASLPLPEQEVVRSGDGYALRLRPPVPAEDWNAQLSLLTGMAAATLMQDHGVGVLRTMPAPEAPALQHFRDAAAGLGVPWPAEVGYGAFLRTLDPARPEHLALLHAAGALFRGAGYVAFTAGAPAGATHAAVAAPYAHVTAPLRRLVDRFGLLCCLAAVQERPVDGWVVDALAGLPATMAAADRLASQVEHACLDAVEAAVLAGRTSEVFEAVVVSVDHDGVGGRVQLADPPVLARCTGPLVAGTRVRVRVAAATADEVTFSVA